MTDAFHDFEHRVLGVGLSSQALKDEFMRFPDAINMISSMGSTLMHFAARCGDDTAIEVLVQLGCTLINTPNLIDNTPLHSAVLYDQISTVETLIRLGSNAINEERMYTPIHIAVTRGNVRIIETLIRLGCKHNRHSLLFCTAVQYNRSRVIETLVTFGNEHIDHGCNGNSPVDLCFYTSTSRSGLDDVDSVACLQTLIALGAQSQLTYDEIGLTEDDASEIRYRTYFRRSLSARLLFVMDERAH